MAPTKKAPRTADPLFSGSGLSPELEKERQRLAAHIPQTAYYTPVDPPVFDGVKTRAASDVYNDFYKLDPEQLEGFQLGARRAGLYGSASDKVRVGDFDDMSFAVWKGLVDRAAGFTAAGKKVSPVDALSQAIAVGSQLPGPDAEDPLRATNPADFAAIADAAGQEGLGYELDDAQQARVAGRLSAMEQPYLGANGSVAPPGTGAVQAAARDEVRRLDPTRFDARRVVGAFDIIQRALAGN